MTDTETAPAVDVRELHKAYAGSGRVVEAIGALSFAVGTSEFVCLVGPSGCGKTTLLKCIAGLLDPTSGSVRVNDAVVTGPPARLAVVFQEYGRSLFPWMRVRDNVELPLKQQRVTRPKRRELVAEALAAVGLHDIDTAYPWQLSGGMQQRVAIARAVAYQPRVLLMDEPFAAVDAQTRADLEDLIRAVWSRFGMTVLFVTHDIDEAVYLGDRVLVLSSAPTILLDDLAVGLPDARDQLTTRASAEFTELRGRVFEQIQQAKRGEPAARPETASNTGKAP